MCSRSVSSVTHTRYLKQVKAWQFGFVALTGYFLNVCDYREPPMLSNTCKADSTLDLSPGGGLAFGGVSLLSWTLKFKPALFLWKGPEFQDTRSR